MYVSTLWINFAEPTLKYAHNLTQKFEPDAIVIEQNQAELEDDGWMYLLSV